MSTMAMKISMILVQSFLAVKADHRQNPLAQQPNATTNNLGLMEVDIMKLLQQALNFTFEIRVPRDTVSFGTIRHGVGTGALGQLIRKEVDLFISGAEMKSDKFAYVDPSAGLFTDTMKIMIPYPGVGRKADAFIAIYSLEVWACIIGFTILVAATLQCFIKMEQRKTDASAPVRNSVSLMIVGLIASQSNYFWLKRFAHRLVWAFWCLSLVVLVNVYTGTLISNITAPSYRFLANSIEDVAKNEKIMPYLIKGFLAEDFIMGTPLNAYKPIRNRLMEHQELRLPSNSDFTRILADTKYGVFLGTSLLQNALIVSDAKKFHQCRFTLAKKAVSSRHICFLLQKNSPLTANITRGILLLQQSGLMEEVLTKYVPRPDMCVVKNGQISSKLSALRLDQLSDALIFLLIGLLVSLVVFAGEICLGMRKRRTAAHGRCP